MKTTREIWKELEDWRKAFREREYAAHKDVKHPLTLGDGKIRRSPQRRLSDY